MSARRCASSRSCATESSRFRDVAKNLLERLEPRHGLVMCQVEMQRRDRDEAVLHGFEVGSFARLPGGLLAADPVVLASARVEALDDTFGIDPLSEARHADSGEGAGGEVDVENDVRIAVAFEDDAGQ